ncbi:MAG: hypothetical protein F2825_00515 [Actinobacteria bacterium]|uniref:Unannotated protein n=1 Tax=freshwater metagenome TaxID=449393 RepID=A0A6J7FUB6_9ZZZZ|nr:hypothetical protein [Actinomycetota bacterium]
MSITSTTPDLTRLTNAGTFTLDHDLALRLLAADEQLERQPDFLTTFDVSYAIGVLLDENAIRSPHRRWELQLVHVDTDHGYTEAALHVAVENWAGPSGPLDGPFLRLSGLAIELRTLTARDLTHIDDHTWLQIAERIVDAANAVLHAAAALTA